MPYIQLDIDEEKMLRPLSWREKFCIRLLIAILSIVLPARYPHQLKELFKEIFEGEK